MASGGGKSRKLFYAAFIFFSLLHLFIVLVNHRFYRSVALDYAVYNYAWFDYAHFSISPCPVYIFPFPATFLQDHFSLTLMWLAPLYWILKPVAGTYSLLIIQWGFIVAGAWATHRLISRRFSDPRLGLFALLYYFLLFGRYAAYRADVNLAIIGSALVPVFLLFFLEKRWVPAALVFLLLMLNREDYGLWFFFIGLTLLWEVWKDKTSRFFAGGLTGLSMVFFLLIFFVIIPALEDENKKYALFDFTVVGENAAQALRFILTHPLEAIKYLFVNHSEHEYYKWVKFDFYLVYAISGGLLLLLRPAYLIAFVPILAKKMYDDNPLRWSSENYYSVEFVSLMPVLVFMVIGSFRNSTIRAWTGGLVCVVTTMVTIYKMSVPPGNPVVGESNKYNVVNRAFYKPEFNDSEVREILAEVSPGASVSASCRLLPHLTFRRQVYYFPNISDAAYIILFKRNDAYPLPEEEYQKRILELRTDPGWRLVKESDDVILFSRVAAGTIR